MLFQKTISSISFNQWLCRDKENKNLIYGCVVIMIISFGWIKYMYPYPNFMPPDSYNYLEAAANNDFINVWPIGYSKFLRLVSVFTRSHMALVIFQYITLTASLLYFLFSIRYLLSPSTWIFRIIIILSIANPLLPHIANFISSDCLFAALSLIWFTQLLWITYQPTTKLLIIHAVIVLLAFTVRFTSLYYPLLSIIVIFFAKMSPKTRNIGLSSIFLLILGFIGRTQHEYKLRTDTTQYSAFGGWQLAANALYGYAYDKPDSTESVPSKFRELHSIVNRHMDSIRLMKIRPDKEPGIYYLWDFKSPLRLYLKKQIVKNNKKNYFENWASVAPLFNAYGRWLITNHTTSFVTHFGWPNLVRYYNPPAFFMGSYNLGNKKVEQIAVTWFNWTNNQLPTRIKNRQIYLMQIFPNILSILNPAFLISGLFFISFACFHQSSKTSRKILYWVWLVWFSNIIFSVLSAPIELRYQIFPLMFTFPFCLLMISFTLQSFQRENKSIYNKSLKYETM